jgi:hypothetical protein
MLIYLDTGRDTPYMPVWPILLYSGQTQLWSTITKSALFLTSSQSLDPTGGHPPDTSPRSCRGPPVLTEGPWQVQHNISFPYIPALDYTPVIRLYAGPPRIYWLLFLLQKLIRPVPKVFQTRLVSRTVTPAHSRNLLEKPHPTVSLETCYCSVTVNGHIK